MEEKNMDIFYELQTKPPPGKLKQHSIVDKERKKTHTSLDFVICQYILSCVICFFSSIKFYLPSVIFLSSNSFCSVSLFGKFISFC